ncbi:MAG TPA: hypothetical protein VIU38_01050, partial [Anaerolineales bacterium]
MGSIFATVEELFVGLQTATDASGTLLGKKAIAAQTQHANQCSPPSRPRCDGGWRARIFPPTPRCSSPASLVSRRF